MGIHVSGVLVNDLSHPPSPFPPCGCCSQCCCYCVLWPPSRQSLDAAVRQSQAGHQLLDHATSKLTGAAAPLEDLKALHHQDLHLQDPPLPEAKGTRKASQSSFT